MQLTTKFLSITRGKHKNLLRTILSLNYATDSKQPEHPDQRLELTRFRKKPETGKADRFLKAPSQVFDFNAWLVKIKALARLMFSFLFLF